MKEDRGRVEYCAVCDQCGFDWMWSDRGYFKFCPNCGAKMDAQRKGVNKVSNLSRERPLNMTEYICKQDAIDAIHEFPMFMECDEIYIY